MSNGLVTGDVQMLVQRQEAEQEMTDRLQKMQVEKQIAVEMASSLQRSLAVTDADKRQTVMKLQKDKSALKKTLDKVSCRVSVIFNVKWIQVSKVIWQKAASPRLWMDPI